MRDADIRWIERYSNFERTFVLLNEALRIKNPLDLGCFSTDTDVDILDAAL